MVDLYTLEVNANKIEGNISDPKIWINVIKWLKTQRDISIYDTLGTPAMYIDLY